MSTNFEKQSSTNISEQKKKPSFPGQSILTLMAGISIGAIGATKLPEMLPDFNPYSNKEARLLNTTVDEAGKIASVKNDMEKQGLCKFTKYIKETREKVTIVDKPCLKESGETLLELSNNQAPTPKAVESKNNRK
jgi:hypothetical protein